MDGPSSPTSSETDEWSQLELFSEKQSVSSASSAPPSSSSEQPAVSRRLRLKPGLLGQTITMVQLGQTYTAEIVKLGKRMDGTPSILLRRIVDEPAEPINIGGVLIPAEAEWLIGWNECRPFIDARVCPLLD